MNADQSQLAVLRRALDLLAEHFECVHIFVSTYDPDKDSTTGLNIGRGNQFARVAQVADWIDSDPLEDETPDEDP
jgi:hypothetical protein